MKDTITLALALPMVSEKLGNLPVTLLFTSSGDKGILLPY